MADVNVNEQATTTEVFNGNLNVEGSEVVNETNETSDVETLLAQLAEERTQRMKLEKDNQRLKTTNDKVMSENAERKRRERASLTAEEQAKAEIQEEIKRIKEENEALKNEMNLSKAVSAYKGIIEDDKISILIDAVNDKDHEAIANMLKSIGEKGKKDGYAEYLKSRPQTNAGSGSGTMTMDEIMSIKDASERQRMIAQNIHLFDK